MVAVRRTPELRLVRAPVEPEPRKSITDAELISAFEQGQPNRAGALYDHLVGVVEATLYRVLGRRGPDHDDLVQNTFEQILITLKKKRFARACSLKSWAASIATNIALNALRSRGTERKFFDRTQHSAPELPGTEARHNPERITAVQRDVEELRRQLAQLSSGQAHALVLHDALGYELAEIAVMTGVSVAAAQSRLVRGRRKLKKRLIEAGIRLEKVPQ